jgi:hypothetical protein
MIDTMTLDSFAKDIYQLSFDGSMSLQRAVVALCKQAAEAGLDPELLTTIMEKQINRAAEDAQAATEKEIA